MWARTGKRAFFWILVLFVAQNALYGFFFGSTLPFVLLGVVFFALRGGAEEGMWVGAFAGLCLEMFGIGRMGFQIAILGSIGILVGYLSSKIFSEGVIPEFAVPVGANYLAALLNLVVAKMTLGEEIAFSVVTEAFSWAQLWGTLIGAPVVFYFLKKTARHARQSAWQHE